MRAALDRVDVVDVGIDLFRVAVVVLQRDVDRDDLVGIDADRLRDDGLGPCVEVLDELAQAFLGIKHLAAENLPAGGLGLAGAVHLELVGELALVGQADVDALVQEGQLAQAGGQGFVAVDRGLGENGRIRVEGDGRAGVGGLPHDFHGSEGLALGVGLFEHFAFTVHLGHQRVGQGVHAGYAHAVQAAGDFVAVLVELAAGVEDGEDHLQGGTVFLLMHARRNAAAVVLHADGVSFEDAHVDGIAETGHGLVDTVVHHFINEVVQAPFGDVADIHRRALADCFESFQHLDTVGGILLFRKLHIFFLDHLESISLKSVKDTEKTPIYL